MTATDPLQPTMSLIGASSASSAGLRAFPRWTQILGVSQAQLVNVDISADAPEDACRAAVARIKSDAGSLGAFVAAHRQNLLHAAGPLFDDLSSEAMLSGRVSCLYKYDGHLLAHDTAPEALGQALSRLLGHGYWRKHRADLLCLGAGGATVALLVTFATRSMIDDRPRQLLLVDRDLVRLQSVERLLRCLSTAEMAVQLIHNPQAAENARLLTNLPPRSVVVNSGGDGRRQSPLTDAAPFPRQSVVWDLRYGDESDFLRQARAQAQERGLQVADGRDYFLSSWATVLGYVFGLAIDDHAYARLGRALR